MYITIMRVFHRPEFWSEVLPQICLSHSLSKHPGAATSKLTEYDQSVKVHNMSVEGTKCLYHIPTYWSPAAKWL